MERRKYLSMLFVFIVILLVSCSPSEPEVTPTATALPPSSTPTPVPPTETPTPTPIPYDLSLLILNEEGTPLQNAEIFFEEEIFKPDKDGLVSLFDLPGSTVDFIVRAPGYFTFEAVENIDRGENTREIVLNPDPFGLLPTNACAPGETLLYLEDFQDGEVGDWDLNETPPDSWVIEPEPKIEDNSVMKASQQSGWIWFGGRETYSLNNVVWRLRTKIEGQASQHLIFRFVENGNSSLRYTLGLGPQNISLGRIEFGNWMDLGSSPSTGSTAWHLVEIGYFDGTVTVYIDGKEQFSWKDSAPWQGGTINLEPMVEEGAIYYDDISICGLDAPFEPIPRPKTGYNLTIQLMDTDGNPVTGAPVKVSELGNLNEATQISDNGGMMTWMDLPPGKQATIALNVPGYFPREEIIEINKGDNRADITLERDLNGMLASEACTPGEKLIFLEDLQDEVMQGWNNLNARLQAGVPNISIIEDPALQGNKLLMASSPGPNAHVELGQYETQPLGDAVWRMDVKSWKNMHLHAQWHNDNQDNVYIAFIYGEGENGGRLQKFSRDASFEVFTWNKRIGGDDQWHTIEISTYQGEYQIWIDGALMGRWLDQDPILEGYLGIGLDLWAEDALIYFDNIRVCELSEPFVSIFTSE